LQIEFGFDGLDYSVDWFGPEFGVAYAEVDSSASVSLFVGVILDFLDYFGFLVVLQLFS